MKVLYFLFEGFDTTNGTNHLALAAMQAFLDNGIEVYLVTSHSKGLFPDIPESIKNRKGFTYSVIQRSSVEKRNFGKRYMDGISYAYKASKEWRKHSGEIDAVILQSTPTVFFSAFLLHRYLKKPVIFNSFDMFPDGPFLFGAFTNKIVFTILAVMQDFVYRTSKKIVVISDDMKNTYMRKGIAASKIITIPIWYDSKTVREVNRDNNQFIQKYQIENNKFIVQYAGNFGFTFNYRAVIEVARLLRGYDNIVFHMIGTGGFEDEFKSEVKKEKLENIIFYPWQESGIISDVYSACDIEFIPLSKKVIWTSYPSKSALLMACGRTFICMCESKSEFYKFVNQKKIGICVPLNDYARVSSVILTLSKERSFIQRMEKNARICARTCFSSDLNAVKYVDVFRKVTSEIQYGG